MTVEGIEADLDGLGLRIGVVHSRFNLDVCTGLRRACLEELLRLGVAPEDILVAEVPGALELPQILQKMAASEQFDALVALGSVIRGETYHFELVSNESASGISHVALEFGLPVANGVLTTDTDEQALSRMQEKGAAAARAAVEMANLSSRILALAEGVDVPDELDPE